MKIQLFHNKYAGHHGINTVADNITINDLDNGTFFVRYGNDALKYLETCYKHPVSENDLLKEEYFLNDVYELAVYTKTIDNVEAICTVISINTDNLIKYNNETLPYPQLFFHICYNHQFYEDVEKKIAI